MAKERSEQQLLDETVEKALAETGTKIDKALESTGNKTDSYVRDIWAAAEASEYSCLVYSLAHDLDTPWVSEKPRREQAEPSSVLGNARDTLEKIRALRGKGDKRSIHEGYNLLRGAADSLRKSYLDLTKPRSR